MDTSINPDLIKYAKDMTISTESKLRIAQFCKTQPLQSIIVYRGHTSSNSIYDSLWYSSTKSYDIAKTEFSGEDCCVFKIHLINIPTIDVNEYVGSEIGHYSDEQEIIFLGGGTFYKNKELSKKGFQEIKDGYYECWYKFNEKSPSPKKNRVEHAFRLIDATEYEYIDGPEDIFVPEITPVLTEDEKRSVFTKIKKLLSEIEVGEGYVQHSKYREHVKLSRRAKKKKLGTSFRRTKHAKKKKRGTSSRRTKHTKKKKHGTSSRRTKRKRR